MRSLPHLAAALFLGATSCGGDAGPPATRIVLVTIDTLRADSLTAGRMPDTYVFAERGQRFESFFASSSTTQPTHASLLTGLYPWEHGVTRNGVVLGEEHETLAERLRGAGFTTHAVVASFPLHRRFGYAQGFDEYEDAFRERYVRVWEGEQLEDGRFYSLADAVVEEALGALARAEGERQFFWFHFFDPHDPYGDAGDDGDRPIGIAELLAAARRGDADAIGRVGEARRRYDDDVRALDRALGRLFARLDEDAARLETHVVFTSDHGESFGELGCLGHGKRLTREQVQVPFFVVSPRLEPGVRAEAAGSVDVPRTILSLAGLEAGGFSGHDLLAAREAPAGVFGMRRTFADPRAELLVDGRTLALDDMRFYALQEGMLVSGNAERLFEEDDPDRPLADRSDLRRLFGVFEERLAGASAEELTDPDVQDALRRLGYAR